MKIICYYEGMTVSEKANFEKYLKQDTFYKRKYELAYQLQKFKRDVLNIFAEEVNPTMAKVLDFLIPVIGKISIWCADIEKWFRGQKAKGGKK